MFRHLCTAFLALVLSHLAGAQFTLPGIGKSNASTATLVAEHSAIAAGKPFTVALQLQHPAGWHSYYKNSGGIEIPPAIVWKLPEGFTAGPIQWPVPEIKISELGKSLIYTGSPIFLIEITPPKSLASGQPVTLSAHATWQICDKSCKDEAKDFTLDIPVAEASAIDPAQAPLFATARKKLPAANLDWIVTAHTEGNDLRLCLEPKSPAAKALQSFDFDFVSDQPFVDAGIDPASVRRKDDTWIVPLKRRTEDFIGEAIPQENAFSGILVSKTAALPSVAIPTVTLATPPPESLPFSKYLPILGGMLLGGLILNLMPCVFPVIGLKIMGFVEQAGANRRKVVFHGFTFTLGVLASFGVISGILFAARTAAIAGGKSAATIGWGYQLQNPWLVLGLMVLMFVLALNMFGLFEIGASATSVGGNLQSKQGLAGSFFSGVLATIVATPCSAPFLGIAIGTAVGLPALQFFSAFGAMAIGLALPYLILSAFPSLINFLPRPGKWMESFKQGMSFLLFATAGFLLWVYAGQIGLENLLGPIFGLSAIAVAAWIYGRWHLPHLARSTRLTALLLGLVFAAGGFYLATPPKPSAIAWEPWSQEKVDAAIAAGRPVYIDFTAQWCATCQLNKKRAYTPEVIDLIKRKNILTLKADKTNPNPQIEAKLAELNRTAIPVNVLVVPGKDQPFVTPELLSPRDLTDLFKKEIP